MKRRTILICCALLALAIDTYAGYGSCAERKASRHKAQAKTTTADAGENDYDMKHLVFNLNVADTSIDIKGDVATTAQVVAPSMADYVFELGTTMIIDSVKLNDALLPLSVMSSTGSVRRMALPSALSTGAMFTARIYYHGTPPSGSGFFNGVTHDVTSHGTHMMYTVSDPWVALNWWPCKQSVNDQIDSVHMNVTVPYGVTDGSNGVLESVDNTTTPGFSTFHWVTRYAIDYYLISIAVAKYGEYRTDHVFPASSDHMLIQNFFLDTATFNPLYKANFDSIGQFIDHFSSLFGRYPFWQEKYGVCYTSLGGGMEHQTMTTIGVPDITVIAHELCHQWFGDHVTYKTWGDMWLSEGFATFSEQLYMEQFRGVGAAKSYRQNTLGYATSDPNGRTYVTDTSTSDSLFTRNQYQKAAMIISTLRYMAPDDATFFQVLKNYQTAYGFGNASTADFKATAEAVYGYNLDTFFNQWIYGRGYPMYKVSWNQIGATVWVKLVQTQSCPSYTNHFSMPVQLQLHAASADTLVKVYVSDDAQVFSFNWAPTMTTSYLNPEYRVLCKQNGAITKDVSLGMTTITPGSIKIQPNPTKNYWQVGQLPENTALALVDMNGRILWEGKSSKGSTMIPGEHLPAGNYILKLSGGSDASVQLVHW